MNLEYDELRFEPRKGDYLTGPAAALRDPLWQARAQDYRRRMSGTMRLLSGDDIFKIPKTTGYSVSWKYDGEFALVAFDGKNIFSVNPGGTVRIGLPCLTEAAELLKAAGVGSCLLGGEFYQNDETGRGYRVHHIIKLLRSPKSEAQLKNIGLAIFDVLELDGNPVESVADVSDNIEKWFKKGKYVHPVKSKQVDSIEGIREIFNDWVVEKGAEGLVVRHQQAGWFKIKERHNLDAAVIGFSEGSDERKGLLHDLLVAVMRNDGTFHELCRVGGGFTEDERRTIPERLKQRIVPSEYIAVNSDFVAYEMIEPGPVIEISFLDIISESTKGAVIPRPVLGWDGEKYSHLQRLPLVSVISPQFIRFRDDKEANAEDVNIRQLSEMFEIPDAEKPAHGIVIPPSEILERVVYTKTLKGNTMVRKLFLWKTNKTEEQGFPGFVVYLTDFSPNRKTPLESEIRVTNHESTAQQYYAQFAEEYFVKGWEKVK